MLRRVTGILWGQLNRLTIGRRCWAKLLAWSVRLIRNINCRRMRLELMNRRRPQYISIIILPRGWLIRLRKIWSAPIKENIQGYIESLGFHVIASIPGLSISKKDTSGFLGDNFSLNCAGIWTKDVHPNTRAYSTAPVRSSWGAAAASSLSLPPKKDRDAPSLLYAHPYT